MDEDLVNEEMGLPGLCRNPLAVYHTEVSSKIDELTKAGKEMRPDPESPAALAPVAASASAVHSGASQRRDSKAKILDWKTWETYGEMSKLKGAGTAKMEASFVTQSLQDDQHPNIPFWFHLMSHRLRVLLSSSSPKRKLRGLMSNV